ncbi:MAG TPA: hypothetical protein VIK75_10230 [Calditerricola sp.]
MSRQNDGASAFPQHPEMCDAHPDFQVVSLCDYFAADAMLAARSEQIPDPLRETAPELLEALRALLWKPDGWVEQENARAALAKATTA